jgi:hypothetical protein
LKYKAYLKAFRVVSFTLQWSKWYFLVKYNTNTKAVLPRLTAWYYRSLYTQRKHYVHKAKCKKMLFLHLFWTFDIWQLAQPMYLTGISNKYPLTMNYTCFSDWLEIYSHLSKWQTHYSLNREKMHFNKVVPQWLHYKPQNWMSRPYTYFVTWRIKSTLHRALRRKKANLWFLSTWFLENSGYHKIQARFLCQGSVQFPTRYTKILWLRLLHYPCLYNYRWLKVLTYLSQSTNKDPLPWHLLYESKQVWMFDNRARCLAFLLKALVLFRVQITEYILVKRWQDLLLGDDALSQAFQIKIRALSYFQIAYRQEKKEVAQDVLSLMLTIK